MPNYSHNFDGSRAVSTYLQNGARTRQRFLNIIREGSSDALCSKSIDHRFLADRVESLTYIQREQIVFSLGHSFAMNERLQRNETGQSAVETTEAFLTAMQIDVRANLGGKDSVK